MMILGLQDLAVSCQLLRHVHGIAAAVIAVAGIALGIFVGKAGPHSHHHRRTDDVFGSDQFNVSLLAGKFLLNGRAHLRV